MSDHLNLIEGIQRQCARCRDLIGVYKGLGPRGSFGAMVTRKAIMAGEDALASGDVIRMIAAYKELEECE